MDDNAAGSAAAAGHAAGPGAHSARPRATAAVPVGAAATSSAVGRGGLPPVPPPESGWLLATEPHDAAPSRSAPRTNARTAERIRISSSGQVDTKLGDLFNR